jgi:chromosomal replication initiation ATPase DnaA
MSGQSGPRQLALALEHAESFAREDFIESATNAAALALIDGFPDWPSRVMALVGPPGAGKSHLAAIWAVRVNARVLAGRGPERDAIPELLNTGALVVEDLDREAADETDLFHLLNLARQENAWLLLTARRPPATWTIALPDLASRLRAIPVVNLAAPDDALLRALLLKLFADRQLAVDEALLSYLLSRIERSPLAARAAVERLDREALRQKRAVNRAFAAEIYRDLTPNPET